MRKKLAITGLVIVLLAITALLMWKVGWVTVVTFLIATLIFSVGVLAQFQFLGGRNFEPSFRRRLLRGTFGKDDEKMKKARFDLPPFKFTDEANAEPEDTESHQLKS